MSKIQSLSALFAILLSACAVKPEPGSNGFTGDQNYGQGGAMPKLILPFESGEYWYITQTYNTGSHINYGFTYGNDSYAVDFSQSGCNAYGKAVTPIASGEVMEVYYEGNGDKGYGNSVLIDHGEGLVSRYAHFSDILVYEGEVVSTSDVIGYVGNTGYAVGSACSEHPGTHLHLALYKNGQPIKPEPLSDISPLVAGCWVAREGQMSCGGNPGEYDPIEDEGEMRIEMVDHSPSWGTASETKFVWVALIDSPDLKPSANLHIHNRQDGVTYEFQMETQSQENPWIFVYRKDLRDSDTYNYWVSASNGDGNSTSSTQSLNVLSKSNMAPDILSAYATKMYDMTYEWRVNFESYSSPQNATLNIVNPDHATIFDFGMDMWHEGDRWSAGYEKSLQDNTVYPYWMNVENGNSVSTSSVGWLKLSN